MTCSKKYFHYTPLKNSVPNSNLSENNVLSLSKGTKIIKIKVRPKLIYTVEIMFYTEIAFLKFYPKMFEEHDDKYKKIGIGLSIGESRRLLNTCCKIVYEEMNKTENISFGFIGQCYEKDDRKDRKVTKRFDWYVKQVAIFFSPENYNHIKIEKINFYCIKKKTESKFMAEKFIETLDREGWITDFMTKKVRDEYLLLKEK